jgi:hypothetical protein
MHLVDVASKVSRTVCVYASTKGRGLVSDEAKQRHLNDVAAALFPSNVELHFCATSPIGAVYEVLGNADKSLTDTSSYAVFVARNDDDKGAWNERSVARYLPHLLCGGRFTVHPIDRGDTDGVSGTRARDAIERGDFIAFSRMMPDGIDAAKAWDTLGGRTSL